MDEADAATPRWVQRFRNFDGALLRLREGVELLHDDPDLHAMTKEGLVQRFEFTFELAWKTLKDYLVFRKVTLTKQGPGDVIRAAVAARYVNDGETWMDALDARNEMSHVYRSDSFERVLADVVDRFHPLLEDFHIELMMERAKLDGY